MANHRSQFDTDIEIVTPENIAFRYRVAGPFRRLPAYLIDLAIRLGIALVGLIAFTIVFGVLGIALGGLGPGLGLLLTFILWFLLAWFYGGLLETYFNGQTPGKRLLRIRVVTVDGQPINGLQAVLRNVLRSVDALPPPFFLVGLVTTVMNDRFQRLGDLASGTMVIVEEPHWLQGVVRMHEPQVQQMAASIPPTFQASRSLGRVLAAYVNRRRNFSWPRRLEIARHVGEPLRERLRMPPDTDLDLLLCGLYQRTFITDRDEESSGGVSPFAPLQSPFVPIEAVDDVPATMERLDGRP